MEAPRLQAKDRDLLMPVIDMVDDHVRHHITVQRLASGTAIKFEPIFAELRDQLNLIIMVNKQTIIHPSRSGVRALLTSMRNAIAEAYAKIEPLMFDELRAFTAYELDFHRRLLERRTGVSIKMPSETRIRSIAERGRIGEHASVGRIKKYEGATVRMTLRAQEARAYKSARKRVMLAIVAAREARRQGSQQGSQQ